MSLRVLCPATTANLGPGFDALGLAFDRGNEFEIEAASTFVLSAEGHDADLVPRDPARHALVSAYQATRAALGLEPAPGLRVHGRIWAPPARGLGSSATATAAGILAAEALAERSLEPQARLELAARLEGHPDNVVPCLLGGLCISVAERAGGALWVERFELPSPPEFVVAIPEGIELSTEAMRSALPAKVDHGDAVATAGRAALLIAALLGQRPRALERALQDWLHEPYRGPRISGFVGVRVAGAAAGAHGVVISGSGPTLLALAPAGQGQSVAAAMVSAWSLEGITAKAHVLGIDLAGARIL